MSGQSTIEWTQATWNPVTGCSKVLPGCAHCYAETFAERWRGVPGHVYEQGFDLRLWPERLELPLQPCTAHQLAHGLGWVLTRTVDALQQLEASLASTGQILTRLGHHRYMREPRPGLLPCREIARCLRHTREPLDLTAAGVLQRALTCPREDRARGALRTLRSARPRTG